MHKSFSALGREIAWGICGFNSRTPSASLGKDHLLPVIKAFHLPDLGNANLTVWEGDLCEKVGLGDLSKHFPSSGVKGNHLEICGVSSQKMRTVLLKGFFRQELLEGWGVDWSHTATNHWERFEVSEQVFWGCFCLFALSGTTQSRPQNILEGGIVCIFFCRVIVPFDVYGPDTP